MSNHNIARFPHMSSHIAEDVKYDIVVGRIHDFRRAVLDRSSFVRNLVDVVLALVAKEYDEHRTLQDIRRCCLHHPELFGTGPNELYQQVRRNVNRRVQM